MVFIVISVGLLVTSQPVVHRTFSGHPFTPLTNEERRARWAVKYYPEYGYGDLRKHY
jgi:hypothetical protein